MLEEALSRFQGNVERVRNLVKLYGVVEHGRGRQTVGRMDILRAAVVLLHASFEDFIRAIMAWKLPLAAEERLEDVPLAGQEHRTKFNLGALAAHRGKTVDDLLRESVLNHLQLSTFNNPEQIGGALQKIGVNVAAVNGRFTEVGEMNSRRHHIVHRADANPKKGKGHHLAQPIAVANVEKWITAVTKTVDLIASELRQP